MNSTHNKNLIQSLFDAVARGDRSQFQAHLADDVVLTVTGEHSWSGTYEGKACVLRDLYGRVSELAPGPRRTIPTRILADGEWVVVEARGDMTSRAGVPYRNHYCLMYRVVDDRIVEMKEYQDSLMCEQILGRYPGRFVPATG